MKGDRHKRLIPISIDSVPSSYLPKGWEWVPLVDVARLETGHTPSRRQPEYWGGEVRWLSLKDIKHLKNKYISETEDRPTTLGIENSSARILPKSTVALCRTASVGKVVILERDMATSQDFVAWVCSARINPEYLYYAIKASAKFFDSMKDGSTHKTIYFPVVEKFGVLLPPIETQKRIASILDKSDAIRRKRHQALEASARLIQARFYDMFGDPIANTKGWKAEQLGEVAQLDRGRSRHRPRDEPRLYGDRYPFIQTGDVTNANGRITTYKQMYSEFGLQQSKLWPAGTLCITIAANIAHTAILTFEASFPDSIVGLVPGDDLTIDYVHQWFVATRDFIDQQATQVAQKNINLVILNGLEIPIPPKALQQSFSTFVGKAREIEDRQRVSAQCLEELFNTLVSRAFRGELS
jgi:type I restriction enzyme, S subunit